MNLVKTLAKVAMGVMVARGVGKMVGGRGGSGSGGGLSGGSGRTPGQSSGGLGGLGGADGVGGLSGGNRSSSGGLGGLLGGSSQSGQSSGGLGGLLEGLTKGGLGQQSGGQLPRSGGSSGGGGLADILGGLLGGATGGKAGGGLGDLLENLGGGRPSASQQPQSAPNVQQSCEHTQAPASSGSLGDLLNQAFGGKVAEPKPDQNAHAEIMLRGMLNAAKSDGKFDQAEQQKVMKHLGDISPEERAFVQNEMSKPLDVDAFVRSIPRGLEQQVYVMSLLGIELDSQAEAQYLDRLARGLSISQQQANAIHQQVGVPRLYGEPVSS